MIGVLCVSAVLSSCGTVWVDALGTEDTGSDTEDTALPTDIDTETDSGTDNGFGCGENAFVSYYVDSVDGNDDNDGTSSDAPWKTLEPVNAAVFGEGTHLCFRANGSWTGELVIQGSGTAVNPIIVSRYDVGDAPRIAADAGAEQAVLLRNTAYIEVSDLEITNNQAGPGDYRGISVRGLDAGQIDHVYLNRLWVHDVTGQVYWVGGDIADNDLPWVTFATGWDASKRTGGIVFESEVGSTSESWFNDVQIEDSVISDTSFGGIVFKQLEALGGIFAAADDTAFRPHTDILIRGNYLSQSNADYGCNAIYLTSVQNVVVEQNVIRDAGVSGIQAQYTDAVTVQHNEVFGTLSKAGGLGDYGIDADRATTKTIIQYNYVHDNGQGVVLSQLGFGDAEVRYNLIVSNTEMGINLHSGPDASSRIFNNLFYGSAPLSGTSDDDSFLNGVYPFTNNIFYAAAAGATVRTGGTVTYTTNLFFGTDAVGDNAVTGDPLFVDIGTWPGGDESGPAFDSLSGIMVQDGSPAIDSGISMPDNGGIDFFGNALYNNLPDIGPHEFQ